MKNILCYIWIHRYEDKIKIEGLTKKGLPFSAKEVCKGCGKTRNRITGFIENPLKGAQDGHRKGRRF